ncbi:bifunctional heptose 7-phosphate kinase/heptose 1-phosphate adenyltransferase, partial [Morganella morganii]
SRISPEAPVPVVKVTEIERASGGAAKRGHEISPLLARADQPDLPGSPGTGGESH